MMTREFFSPLDLSTFNLRIPYHDNLSALYAEY